MTYIKTDERGRLTCNHPIVEHVWKNGTCSAAPDPNGKFILREQVNIAWKHGGSDQFDSIEEADKMLTDWDERVNATRKEHGLPPMGNLQA